MLNNDDINLFRKFKFDKYNDSDSTRQIIISFMNKLKEEPLYLDDYNDLEYLKKVIYNITINELRDIDNNVNIYISGGEVNGSFTYERKLNPKTNKYENKELSIFYNTDSYNCSFLESNDIEGRLFGCSLVIKTIMHEIRHLLQYKYVTSNIVSLNSLNFIKEFLLSDEFYQDDNVYDNNHDSFFIEKDANKEAFSKLCDLTNYDFFINLGEANEKYINHEINKIIVKNNDKQYLEDKNDYINKFADELIKSNLYLLDKYPILLKEYNKDGSRKSFYELIVNMHHDLESIITLKTNRNVKLLLINECKDLYYDLLFNSISLLSDDDLDLIKNNFSIDYINNLFDEIIKYKKNVFNHKKELIDIKHNKRLKNDSKCNFYNLLTNDLVYFNNEVISKDNFIDIVLNNYSDEIIDKYNLNYLLDRVSEYGIFILKNGKKISINDFIDTIYIHNINENPSEENIDEFLNKNIKSYNDMDYQLNNESINSAYQKELCIIENAKSKFNNEKLLRQNCL